MKKTLLLFFLILLVPFSISAKKVKFSVDMSQQTVSTYGVYVVGDFQKAAGGSADWVIDATPLTREGSSNIYSTEVDIPANTVYEYTFVNGNLWYNIEFVPLLSRVNEDESYRWIYVDANETEPVDRGAVLFAENAPSGKYLVRFYVDMSAQTISDNGVHVDGRILGSESELDPAKWMMYSFGNNIYERIIYVNAGSYEYKFFNGNSLDSAEIVPSGCANGNGYRLGVVNEDIKTENVCFSSCYICGNSAYTNAIIKKSMNISPTICEDASLISWSENVAANFIKLTDMSGQIVKTLQNLNGSSVILYKNNLPSGNYLVNLYTSTGSLIDSKRIIIK